MKRLLLIALFAVGCGVDGTETARSGLLEGTRWAATPPAFGSSCSELLTFYGGNQYEDIVSCGQGNEVITGTYSIDDRIHFTVAYTSCPSIDVVPTASEKFTLGTTLAIEYGPTVVYQTTASAAPQAATGCFIGGWQPMALHPY